MNCKIYSETYIYSFILILITNRLKILTVHIKVIVKLTNAVSTVEYSVEITLNYWVGSDLYSPLMSGNVDLLGKWYHINNCDLKHKF